MNFNTFLIATSLFLRFFLLSLFTSTAQNGSLDLNFGNAGKVITNFGGNEIGYAVAIQGDGKIVVAGVTSNQDFAVGRYNTNGILDNSFGNGGMITTDFGGSEKGFSVAIQSDGKIVVVGSIINQDFALARYNIDGTLDSTFGNGGKLISDIQGTFGQPNSVVIQTDGKIVIAGTIYNGIKYDNVLIRYNSDGSFDNLFGNGGIQTMAIGLGNDGIFSMALQSDGKIVVCGNSFNGNYFDLTVLRYKTNGTLDSSFATNGIQTTPIGISDCIRNSVAIQIDGKIVVGGTLVDNVNPSNNKDFVLLRYNTNGILDNSFGFGGIAITYTDSTDFGMSVAILIDGKIVLGGRRSTAYAEDFTLQFYKTDGTLDSAIGNAGIVTTDIAGIDRGFAIAIQSDGKIVLAGSAGVSNLMDFALVRYNYSLDPEGLKNFGDQTQVMKSYPNPFSTLTSFQLKTEIHDAQIIVYNAIGQQVKQLSHLNGKEIKLFRDNLLAGIYTIQLKQGTKTIGRDKVIIVD